MGRFILILTLRRDLTLHSIPSAGPATFALLACGCHHFYTGQDIALGDPVFCPSLAQCARAGSRWTTVTSTLVGIVQPDGKTSTAAA